MRDDEFCQMFLYSLINLVGFLLSTIFLTSLYNIKSQYKLLKDVSVSLSKDMESYENSYIAIAVLFSFDFFGFLAFMIIIMLLIKEMKVDKMEEKNAETNKKNEEVEVVNSEERLNNNNNNNKSETPNDGVIDIGFKQIQTKTMIKIMLFLFVFVQIVFLFEIIVLTAYHSVASDLEEDLEKEGFNGKYFTKIYRDLMIVGYIFLFLFIVYDLYTVIVVLKCGQKEAERDDNEKIVDCGCCERCIINCCSKMENAFAKCIDAEVKKRKGGQKEKNEGIINDLKKYRDQLNNLNIKIRNKEFVSNNEMETLNLYKSGDASPTMSTKKIKVTTKK